MQNKKPITMNGNEPSNNTVEQYFPFEVKLLAESGDHYQSSNDFYTAIEYYTAALEIDPANAMIYHKRGWSKAHVGDIQGELEDWSQCIKLNPDFAEAFVDRAVANATLRNYDTAIEDALKAIELKPELKEFVGPIISKFYDKKEKIELVGVENQKKPSPEVVEELQNWGNDRRDFLKQITALGTVVMTAGLMSSCNTKELAGGQKGVKWGMIIDLKKCIGCKACTVACKVENHTPPGVAYNIVTEHETGIFPNVKKEFIPRPCMQCEQPSCTDVCPVTATYQREDGITVIEYDKCIGCKYCIAACPYGARSFDFGHNYGEKGEYGWESEPSPEYGEHRVRTNQASPEGNVRKCTFCMHRIYNGIAPACACTCVGNAIYFGNLADPEAKCMAHGVNLQELLASRSYMRLKEETGNKPRVYYLT